MKRKVGIVGCGAIGTELAKFIDQNLQDKLELTGLCDLNKVKALSLLQHLYSKPAVFSNYSQLIEHTDLIIEAASIECAKELIPEVIRKNKDLIILSVGVFVKYGQLLDLLDNYQGNLFIPSGAICGVDGLHSLKKAKIKKLSLTTSKPPESLKGFLENKGNCLHQEKIIFQGNIKDAIRRFPQNINVAATIFLASGFSDTLVTIKVDPCLEKNTHKIELESDKANIKIEVENTPSKLNPKTSYLAILSTQSLLERIVSNLKIGS